MVSVREAAQNALNFYKDIYPNISGELVEEVELDESQKYWLITLSFPTGYEVQSLATILKPKIERKYKLFKIDAQNCAIPYLVIRFCIESIPLV